MKNTLLILAGLLLMSTLRPGAVRAQYVPFGNAVVGIAGAIAAQNEINRAIAEKTTTTATYRGQSFLMKRTPAGLLTGDAVDRIEQLESQLALCRTALLADSAGSTCPPERRDAIRANLKYIGLARPNWELKAYYQEFKFYQAEDKLRRKAKS